MVLPALLSRDPSMRAMNRTKAERQRKAKEDERKKSSRNCGYGSKGRTLTTMMMMMRKMMMR